ncbi:MAG: RNA pyrophosphohydrolase, partial [Candidatus Thioglobus sp.]
MIDAEGYRANVGIVITNDKQQILLAKRYQQDSWQL